MKYQLDEKFYWKDAFWFCLNTFLDKLFLMQEKEFFIDEQTGDVVINSGVNSLRLTEKEFANIREKRLSGILFGLHKKNSS